MSLLTWLKKCKVEYHLRRNHICLIHLAQMDYRSIKAGGWYECWDCLADDKRKQFSAVTERIEEWKKLKAARQ